MAYVKGSTYVLLGSQRPDIGESVRPFCRLTRMDEAEARTLLSSPGSRIFRVYARRAMAQGLANQLKAIGIISAAVAAEELEQYLYVAAKRVNVGIGGVAASGSENEAPTFIPFADLGAVVMGEVMEEIGRERVLSAKPGEPKVRISYSGVLHVDLHRKSVPVAVRLKKTDFGMNPIVAGEPIEGPTDLARLIEILRVKAPLAHVDDKFTLAAHSMEYSLRMIEAGEVVQIPARSADDEGPVVAPPLPPAKPRDPNEVRIKSSFSIYSTLTRYTTVTE